MSPRNHSVVFLQSQHHVINPTNPRGALDDGVEDWLHIGGRSADDAEHLGRCRLVLQRFPHSALRCSSSRSRDSSCSATRFSSFLSWLSSVARGLFLFFEAPRRAMCVLLTPTLELFQRLTNKRIHSIHR